MKPMQGMLYHTMSARTCRLKAAFRQPDPIRLLTGWAMLGIMLGTWLAERMPETADCFLLTQGLMLSDAARTLGDVLRTALCPLLILLTGIWLSGFSAFGQIPALLILLSRGIAFGIAAGCQTYRHHRCQNDSQLSEFLLFHFECASLIVFDNLCIIAYSFRIVKTKILKAAENRY